MICKNCGSELAAGEVFCGKCGSKVEVEEAVTTPLQETEETVAIPVQETEETEVTPVQETEVVENADNVTPEVSENTKNTKQGKKKKKKWVIWTVIILIVALIGGTVALAFPYINNTFWGIVLSDEDYFKHVVENNASAYADDMADAYSEMMELYKNGETLQIDSKIEVGKKVKDVAYEYSYGSVNLKDLNNISYSGQAGFKDNKLYSDLTYNINDKNFTDYNMIMDDDAITIDFPGISDGGLRTQHQNDSEIMFRVMSAFYEVSPDEDVFKTLYVRYIECLTENIDDVEKTSETITAGNVSKKYTKLSAEIDENTVEKTLENVLKTAKDDEEIKKMIEDFCNSDAINEDAGEVYNEFRDGIDDLLDELDINDEFEFYFNILVDGKGDIVGMGVDGDNFYMYYANALDVNLFSPSAMGTIFEIKVPDFKATLEGSGELVSDKFSGDYTLEVMNTKIANIKLVNLDYPLIKDGIINGKVEVTVADKAKEALKSQSDKILSLIANSKIVIDIKTTEKNKYIADVAITSGSDALVNASIKTDVVKMEVPKINKYIDSNNYTKVNDWYMTLGNNAMAKLNEIGIDVYSMF